MTDRPFSFDDLLGPVVDDNLDEIDAGFSAARAREVLNNPDKLDYLLWTVARVEPGRGWGDAALEDSERGRLNRDLLGRALAARSAVERDDLFVSVQSGITTVAPGWWPGDRDGAFVAPLPFPDGALYFDPGDVTRIPAASFTRDVPAWLGGIAVVLAGLDLSSGAARVPEPDAHGVDDAARAALGLWLARWNPLLDRDVLLAETAEPLVACGADRDEAATLGRAHLALAAGAAEDEAEFVAMVLSFRREPEPDDASPGRPFRAELAADGDA